MKQKLLGFAIAVITSTTLACSASNPTAPANNQTGTPGPDNSTLKASAPTTVSPAGGVELEDLDPVLTINNSNPTYVPGLALTYVFEVLNSANQVVYRSGNIPQGSGGRTSHEIGVQLNPEGTYSWRAWAVYQGLRSANSPVASFKTFSRFGVSCAPTGSPFGIVSCRLAQHGGGGMDHEEAVEFMREVAYDLNRLFNSDQFGILIKTEGNNCLGYSCDIICEGHGGNQNQYDILIDDQFPNWAEVDNPTVRPCEIVK